MLEFRGVHAAFLSDDTPEIDFEGARLSAKSWACSAKVWYSCINNPGIEWLIGRYSGTETDEQLRPLFIRVCRLMGIEPKWDADESAYWFPEVDGKVSKVFAHGLKTQSRDMRLAKIRGSGTAGVWLDQTEEVPQDIAEEIRFYLRQEGYPHQLIFSPNPPDEESYLADQFPDSEDKPGRKYYRVSLYDNAHNLKPDAITKLETMYPPTHAKYRSLILGLRGPNVVGTPVYQGAFERSLHAHRPIPFDYELPVLECIDAGKHHPCWMAAQRTRFGSLRPLGGIYGKHVFLESFLPIVDAYRAQWFPPETVIMRCADPPPDSSGGLRFTHTQIIKAHYDKQKLYSRPNANAPDVRESVVQHIGGLMQRRFASEQAFEINNDPSRWLMASIETVKRTGYFIHGCESSYVWDENLVSVGNKRVQQPRYDQWLEGWQRCLENLVLNFCAGKPTQEELAARKKQPTAPYKPVSAWG